MRSIGHRQHSACAPDSGLSCSAPSKSDRFCFGVSALFVPGSSPLSLPLWIPGQSLPGDIAGCLPEGVINPTPLSFANLCSHWFLICSLPQALVSYLLWTPDTNNFTQTAVDESLELMECCMSRSPCFRSIEEC